MVGPGHEHGTDGAGMNEVARQKLCELIVKYGPTVCGTPGTCKMVLGQQCVDFPAEKELFLRALDKGAVAAVIRGPVGGPWDDLVQQVAESSVSTEDAHWAIESWAIALGKHTDAAPLPPEPTFNKNTSLEVSETDAPRPKGATLAVAIAGAIGSASGGVLLFIIFFGGVFTTSDEGHQMSGAMFVTLALVWGILGILGGGAGGALGWYVNQIQTSALTYTPEQINRHLRKVLIGAFTGAFVVSVIPVCTVGLFGPLIPGFLGGLGGGILGGIKGAAGGLSRTY
jgi:hypothetical protein